MKLFDVLICIYQFALKEDAIIWAFLYLFPKVRRYRLFDASNFDLIYLYLFDFLVKDKHYLFVFEQLGDVGWEQRDVYGRLQVFYYSCISKYLIQLLRIQLAVA